MKKGEPVKEFVNTKLMTRQTYTLDEVSGALEVKDGKAVFTEKDGIDYAATTVQTPGGARVPFLFTVKVGGLDFTLFYLICFIASLSSLCRRLFAFILYSSHSLGSTYL